MKSPVLKRVMAKVVSHNPHLREAYGPILEHDAYEQMLADADPDRVRHNLTVFAKALPEFEQDLMAGAAIFDSSFRQAGISDIIKNIKGWASTFAATLSLRGATSQAAKEVVNKAKKGQYDAKGEMNKLAAKIDQAARKAGFPGVSQAIADRIERQSLKENLKWYSELGKVKTVQDFAEWITGTKITKQMIERRQRIAGADPQFIHALIEFAVHDPELFFGAISVVLGGGFVLGTALFMIAKMSTHWVLKQLNKIVDNKYLNMIMYAPVFILSLAVSPLTFIGTLIYEKWFKKDREKREAPRELSYGGGINLDFDLDHAYDDYGDYGDYDDYSDYDDYDDDY